MHHVVVEFRTLETHIQKAGFVLCARGVSGHRGGGMIPPGLIPPGSRSNPRAEPEHASISFSADISCVALLYGQVSQKHAVNLRMCDDATQDVSQTMRTRTGPQRVTRSV